MKKKPATPAKKEELLEDSVRLAESLRGIAYRTIPGADRPMVMMGNVAEMTGRPVGHDSPQPV